MVREVKAEKQAENVASIAPEDRLLVSRYLGVRPGVACASGLSQVRRKRYLWASWPITASEGVSVTQHAETWLYRRAPCPSSLVESRLGVGRTLGHQVANFHAGAP